MSTIELATQFGRQALLTAFMVAAPILISGLVVGVIISVLQAATQVQEQTLAFVPKILAMTLALFIFLPWMVNILVSFTRTVILSMSTFTR